jgi:hypothetical protein
MPAHASAFTCHFCGYHVTDQDDAQYGWCRRCRDCTGMCAAGRRVVVYDLMNPPGNGLHRPFGRNGAPRVTGPPPRWDVPCVMPADDIWEMTCDGVIQAPDGLCAVHGQQLHYRLAPGIAGRRKGPMPRHVPRSGLLERLAVGVFRSQYGDRRELA